jgi:hypothetical protein
VDKRKREATKRHRSDRSSKYVTVSLTLNPKILKTLEKKVNRTEDKNASKFIEEIVSPFRVYKMPKRRKFKSFPTKRTYTFTENFKAKIMKSGNMSLFVEDILMKHFNLK